MRIPCLPVTALLSEELEGLKENIKDSSPDFYHRIRNLDASQLDALPLTKRYTLWKYFNRSKYRATPYGGFAGVSLCELNLKSPNRMLITNEQVAHQFPDWTLKPSGVDHFSRKEKDLKLFANSTWYVVGQDIRYITQKENKHQVSSISKNKIIIRLLKSCQAPAPYSSLKLSLTGTGYTEQQIDDLIGSLLSCQLLFSSQHPNIIGQEYFSRISLEKPKGPTYTICERQVISGSLSQHLFQKIPMMIQCLHSLLPPPPLSDLESFITQFQYKFGESEVSIMIALDPETGVGYGNMPASAHSNQLLKKLNETRKAVPATPIEQLKTAILKTAKGFNDPRLTSLDLKTISISIPDPVNAIPNTISALVSVAGDKLIVDAAGGCTANGLLGRFTLMGEEYLGYSRQLATIEQGANPAVIFFDVGYTNEGKIDNVNRRGEIYERQLNIHNYDTSQNPLTLNDIVVSVENQQLILRSEKLNKRLIPRIANAYNAERSDLPIFRLLNDLQHQGLQSSLNLNLQSVITDLPFYPRVTYGNIIISPARWKIDIKDIRDPKSVSELGEFLTSSGVGRFFKTGAADQTLCFDLLDMEDIKMFIHYMTKHKAFYIWEAFIEENSIIKDLIHRPYLPQVLLSIYHSSPVYHKIDSSIIRRKFLPQRDIVAPGNDWVYFEIYAHPFNSDKLINGPINRLLKRHKSQIVNWHFVRYSKDGDHLRLRIQLKDDAYGQTLTTALARLLKKDLESGTVSELLIRSYKKETARYSGNRMEDIENHFWADSNLVLSLLPSQFSMHQIYHVALHSMISILDAGSIKKMHAVAMIDATCANFAAEYVITGSGYKEINADYREFMLADHPQLTTSQQLNVNSYIKSFISVLIKCKSSLRPKLFTDLLHMHFNRLYNSSQRQHEMVFYEFLSKSIKTKSKPH